MNPNDIYKFTAIGRPVDPTYRTNRIILILTPIAALVAGVLAFMNNNELLPALGTAVLVAIGTFLTWALAREIDPDHEWSAFVSTALYWLGMLLLGQPTIALLALALMMISMRIVSRIVGPAAKIGDSVMMLVLIGLVAFVDVWVLALVGVAALLMDGLMSNPVRRHLLFALLGLAIVGAKLLLQDVGQPAALDAPYLLGVIVIGIAYSATILATRSLECGCDLPDYDLDVRRVRAAMVLALLVGIVAAVWGGNQGVLQLLPLWAGMLGTALYRLPLTIGAFQAVRRP